MDYSERPAAKAATAEPASPDTDAEAECDDLGDALADLHRRITRHEHAVTSHLNRPR